MERRQIARKRFTQKPPHRLFLRSFYTRNIYFVLQFKYSILFFFTFYPFSGVRNRTSSSVKYFELPPALRVTELILYRISSRQMAQSIPPLKLSLNTNFSSGFLIQISHFKCQIKVESIVLWNQLCNLLGQQSEFEEFTE